MCGNSGLKIVSDWAWNVISEHDMTSLLPTIEWCPVSRVPDLMAFIDEVWKPGHVLGRDASLLRWQYQHPLLPNRLSVLIATDSDVILGMLGVIFHQFNDHGTRMPAAMLATWVTRREKRATGLGLRLLNSLHASDVKVIGCLGADTKTTVPICRAYGYAVLDHVPRFIKVFDPEALSALLASASLASTGSQFEAWTQTQPTKRLSSSGEVTRVTRWGHHSADMWDKCWHERLAPQLRSFEKDAKFIGRRYLAHPVFIYTILMACDPSDKCQGLAICRIEQVRDRSEKILHVCEFLAASQTAAHALLAAISEIAMKESICFATCHFTHEEAGRWLEEDGFRKENPSQPMAPTLFQPLDFRRHSLNGVIWMAKGRPTAGALLASSDFYWVRGDGDQDRPN